VSLHPKTNPPSASKPKTFLDWLDAWMRANPWHPRAAPFFVYMIGLLLGQMVYTGAFGLPELPVLIPVVYTVQVALVLYLLIRYRRLLPELNIRFHWLAVPTGIGLLFAWVWLGYATNWVSHQLQGVPILGDVMAYLVPTDPDSPLSKTSSHDLTDNRASLGETWFWSTMVLRLLGMSLVVPLFEELWVRSAVLRGTFSPSRSWIALLQVASDLPFIGDYVGRTKAAKLATKQRPMFTQQLKETRVGQVSLFSTAVSTIIFLLAHSQRDYLGCIACGVVWCALLWYTNKPGKGEAWADQPDGGRMGIGPIAWSHGITNAALWVWTLYFNDWQFL